MKVFRPVRGHNIIDFLHSLDAIRWMAITSGLQVSRSYLIEDMPDLTLFVHALFYPLKIICPEIRIGGDSRRQTPKCNLAVELVSVGDIEGFDLNV